jgi:drug/metabolite transporter (DMT)-like permease
LAVRVPIMVHVRNSNRIAIVALVAAGILWGLSVPLSKLALPWLGAGWLTFVRFAAAAPLLALSRPRALRGALTLPILASGAIGFGGVILLQNAGIEHTSVTQAALVVGAVPALVALLAAGGGHAMPRPLAWVGYALALAGVALVAGAGGDGASTAGDLLVLASAVLSAGFIAVQPRLLAGRDAAAVTAVQFAAGALVALPVAFASQPVPPAPNSGDAAAAVAALALIATPLPFWLFAFGQARVPAPLAGAFVNLEPVVGAAVGWLAFGNSATLVQVGGAAAVLAGIVLSARPDPGSEPLRCRCGGTTKGGPGARGRWRARWSVAGRRPACDCHGDLVGPGERRAHRRDLGGLDGGRARGLWRTALVDARPRRR